MMAPVSDADAPQSGRKRDLSRLLARGQSGMRLLEWLAPLLVRLGRPSDPPLVARGDPVATTAAQWLAASGLDATPAAAGIQR